MRPVIQHGDNEQAAPVCWRSECRLGCYYPEACSEKPPTCPLCHEPAHDYRCGVTP